jgi:RNA 2',3'-cyclic 3'-phosphodiesterase
VARMKKRLFIAVKIDNSTSLLRILEETKSCLNYEKIKWVDPDNLHLTLVFLGDTEERIISKIKIAIDKIKSVQFNLQLNSIGVFRNINFPTILWFGIKSNKIISNLKNTIDMQLNSIGFAIEAREFKPHLTIGRIKYITDKKNLEILLKKFSNRNIALQLVSEIILYESILSSEGPTYKVIHKSYLK